MEKNVDFHDAMKNIAKIIETQYELNYIIPLIGEMIDKFIIEHLIYIFLKSEETGKYNLVWPSACMDKKILTALGRVDTEKEYFLIDNDRIGIFPLIGEDKTLGCIVARGSMEKLNKDLNATIMMVTHDAFTASYADRILFIKDGKIFNELIKGNDSRNKFFDRIIDVITLLGGDVRDVC